MTDFIRRLSTCLADTSLRSPRPLADLLIPEEARNALAQEFSHVRLKPAAVLVGILKKNDEFSIVLTRRSESLKNHPGQISFPGGRMDDSDEDLVFTALRESYEEINLPTHMVDVIGYLPDYPTVTGYKVTPIVGFIGDNAEDVIQADGIEATEIHHLPLAYALDETSYECKLIKRNGIDLPVYHIEHQGVDIWGATAGMLFQLCLQLKRHENPA